MAWSLGERKVVMPCSVQLTPGGRSFSNSNAHWRSLIQRPLPWLALDAAYAYTYARFKGVPAGLTRIPGSVAEVISGGATASPVAGLDIAKAHHQRRVDFLLAGLAGGQAGRSARRGRRRLRRRGRGG